MIAPDVSRVIRSRQCERAIVRAEEGAAPFRGAPRAELRLEVPQLGRAGSSRRCSRGMDWMRAACSGPTRRARMRPQRAPANQITCRDPRPLLRARTEASSTLNPASFNRREKAASGAADQMARMPPGFSAAFALARPSIA